MVDDSIGQKSSIFKRALSGGFFFTKTGSSVSKHYFKPHFEKKSPLHLLDHQVDTLNLILSLDNIHR